MKVLPVLTILAMAACSTTADIATQRAGEGKQIAFDRNKGNCLACHRIDDGEEPGNIGPPLQNLPSRFKNKEQLREQIFDATRFNPETSMPPFGRNRILDSDEIDKIVDYLWSLP